MFQKATKKQAKLRMAIFGPSGSGKTYTALLIAKGLGGKVALIDTEYGSASKYADRFDFDTCSLEGDQSIPAYIRAMENAKDYPILIIDSMSHGWQELLAEMDRLAADKYRGNTFAAWKEGGPKQKTMVRALLSSPCHIIATMRSKTEWAMETNDRGKVQPKRVGLAPEEGKGIEYEFDLLMELTAEHYAKVLKDRTGKFQDVEISKPGEDFGKELAAWLQDGVAPDPVKEAFKGKDEADLRNELWAMLMTLANQDTTIATKGLLKYGKTGNVDLLTGEALQTAYDAVSKIRK